MLRKPATLPVLGVVDEHLQVTLRNQSLPSFFKAAAFAVQRECKAGGLASSRQPVTSAEELCSCHGRWLASLAGTSQPLSTSLKTA